MRAKREPIGEWNYETKREPEHGHSVTRGPI
jgi:hypothetical protein